MEPETWTEAEYLAYLAHERRMYAWVLERYGAFPPAEARAAALACYPYEAPGRLRGLAFHDEAWHWAMLRLHGEGYWRTHPGLADPPQAYREAAAVPADAGGSHGPAREAAGPIPAAATARYLTDYLQHLVAEHLGGDRSRFDELWTLVPDLPRRLRGFDADGEWLHWSPKTFDGWYCVPARGGFDVYYQERGRVGEVRHFCDERAALAAAVEAAMFPLEGPARG
ncbi:MAG TPA: hypothetical protein VFF91_10250 [Pseudoxanthomonas sp.]|nr:hypothetical protein [Pseudoxanthomonas sp.]